MISKLLAALCVTSTLAQSDPTFYFSPQTKTTDAATPEPGSVSATLSIASLNNILQLAAPLAANEIFQNKTFEINYKKKGFLKIYNVEIDSVHTNSVDGFTVKDFSFKNGTNTLVLTVGGVDIDATTKGKATALWLIPCSIEAVKVKNLTMQVEISTDSNDQVHYKVVELSSFHIDDFTVTMGEKIWQSMINTAHKGLLVTFNTLVDRFLPNYIQRKLVAYNNKIATEGPMTFVSTVFGQNLPFNMTMTKYPEFRPVDQMIEIHMDGRFVDPITHQTIDSVNNIWQPRVQKVPQKEQILIHESTANSLIAILTRSYNLMIKNQTLSDTLIQNFPEISAHYGQDAFCEVGVVPQDPKSGAAVNFDNVRGIVYGDSQAQLTDFQIYCNSSLIPTQELAFALEAQIKLVFNATFNNFVIRDQIIDKSLGAVQIATDNIGMAAYNYQEVLAPIVDSFVANYNIAHVPNDLSKKIPTIKFVAGLLMKTLLTPYQEDGFLFGGFKWITDF